MCSVNGKWNIEYTDEFETWWSGLTDAAQDDIDRVVLLLEKNGPTLGYPYSSDIKGSKVKLRELRIQHKGHPPARPVCVRSCALRFASAWWRQDGEGRLVREECANCRTTVCRTFG